VAAIRCSGQVSKVVADPDVCDVCVCVCVCVQTLLPLTPTGELCDLEGNCVDAAEDEIFKLTTQVCAVQLMWRRSVGAHAGLISNGSLLLPCACVRACVRVCV
jgi:hypothetical protein